MSFQIEPDGPIRARYSEVTLKTGLRELVRECFKVKSVVIKRLGIGSSSPWILFGMKGTSKSSTLYFDPFIRNPRTSSTYLWYVSHGAKVGSWIPACIFFKVETVL